LLAVGDFLMEVEFDGPTRSRRRGEGPVLRESFRLSLELGLHARPAAQLAASCGPSRRACACAPRRRRGCGSTTGA
jgi:hypothetical protein